MSSENVALVRSLIQPDLDLVSVVRDDALNQAFKQAAEAFFAADFECSWPGSPHTYRGLDGLRELWMDWLEPWSSYHAHIEELIDLGDRVLALVRDRGRRAGIEGEIEDIGASIWRIRDAKITRIDFYPEPEQAMEAAGLAPSS